VEELALFKSVTRNRPETKRQLNPKHMFKSGSLKCQSSIKTNTMACHIILS